MKGEVSGGKELNQMATGNPGHPNFSGRPNVPGRPAGSPFAAAPPPATSPFLSSGPASGRSDGPSVKPPPTSAPTITTPFLSSGPTVGPPVPGFKPSLPAGNTDASAPTASGPPRSLGLPTSNHFQQFAAPQFSGPPTNPPIHMPAGGPPNMVSSVAPNMPPPFQRPSVLSPNPPFTFRPHSQAPPVQMTSSPQPYAQAPPVHKGTQPQTYAQAPPVQMLSQPQSYAQAPGVSPPTYYGQQPVYLQPPSQPGMASIHSRDQMQHLSAPPMSAMQGLVEDFSFLSLGSIPGSMDPGLDAKALPRPLEGDVHPEVFHDMFPMNCDPKILRLTTSGIPNSQSLASRWHLPLGAVVCPLAEASEGVSITYADVSITALYVSL